MEIKLLLAVIATILVFAGYAPYIRDTIKGVTRPHIFSFFLWALTSVIIFFLQLRNGGGTGAWVTLSNAIVIFVVFLLSLKNGKKDIRKIDYFVLLLALTTIPIWLVAKQPVISIILLALIDGFAFIMSYRKIHVSPWSETVSMWVITTVRYVIIIFALAEWNIITLMQSGTGVLFNLIGVVYILLRRKHIKKPE